MEILTNYNQDTLQLISDNQNYTIQNFWEHYVDSYFDLKNAWYDNSINGLMTGWWATTHGVTDKASFGQAHWNNGGEAGGRGYPKIKLSVFSDAGSFLQSGDLIESGERVDFYFKDDNLFLKPNEFLDSENFSEGNYNLQFDFIQRFRENNVFYISEISPSRKEIRLDVDTKIYEDALDNNLKNHITYFLNEGTDDYNFNSFLELSDARLIPINSYAFDNVTNNKRTLILRLNEVLSNDVQPLTIDFKIVNKFLSSQTERVFFIDREKLAISGLGLEIDEGYNTSERGSNIELSYQNYNAMTGSFGTNIINELQRQKKDINLNIDYSNFNNHVFFGSAKSKLQNFSTKCIKLDGLYNQISSSLGFTSSAIIVDKRVGLFNEIKQIEDDFTHYEYFLYNDGQSYSTASAPGIGTNYAGTDFSNDAKNSTLKSSHNSEGFDSIHKKTTNSNYLHLFTDVYNVEKPPFYGTNKDIYLSFILRGNDTGTPANGYSLALAGGAANLNYDISYRDYNYLNFRRIPYEAFSGSAVLNPTSTGSFYKRYIFKAQQNYWRPSDSALIDADIQKLSVTDTRWSGSNGLYYEILSGSNPISASTSGSMGAGFAYGITDGSGQHRPMFFPTMDNEEGSNIPGYITASVLPQGDLFAVFVDDTNSNEANFTDVKLSYNNPTNTQPFSPIYRPPSGSYAGSSEWNAWYDGLVTSASNYDNDNIHSLVNNLPEFLRTGDEHQTLRDFVNMLGEQFDLLRNYIDNYENFYKMGYKNPNSMPDNLLPLLGHVINFDLFNPYSGSIADYLNSTQGDGIGLKNSITALWKKILNNIVYVYKTKGTKESLNALLNLYGYDADSFELTEYGGSIEEHNPTVLSNNADDHLDGLQNTTGNVSFISENHPFPMLNLNTSTDYLALDWWTNDAKPNGIEFVFHAKPSINTQTLLRSSGSNDYWDLRVVPSGSSDAKGKVEFRLNYKQNVSSAIGTNHISMSTNYIDNIMSDNIYNVMLQRNVVTESNALVDCAFTQSYHMFVARKDGDKIRDVNFISMSSHDAVSLSGSNINQNFITSSALTSKNVFMGENLSGSVAEIRAWDSYVSMSKFKQHVLNYHSIVGGSVTSAVNDIIYRFRLNENIVNWNNTPDSESLQIIDFNPQKIKNYSQDIKDQPSLNFRTFITEQTFYKFNVKGTDEIPNTNQTNLGAQLNVVGGLNADSITLTAPYNPTGKRQYTNRFGKDISYVSQIDSMIINMMSDFKLDNYLDDRGTGSYVDLIDLRKQLISDNFIQVDVASNLKSTEELLNEEFINSLREVIPARTKLDFSYNVKNDILFRSKMKNAILQTQLNPNRPVGSASLAEPTLSFLVNNNLRNGNLDIFNEVTSSTLSVTSTLNESFKNGTLDLFNEASSSTFSVTSTLNENIKTNHSSPLEIIDLSNSKTESVHTLEPSNLTNLLLGSKNEFYKNHGRGDNQTFFMSKNPGIDGNYNTYKYESRFTFPTIGDTEVFMPVSGTVEQRQGQRPPFNHHDNFRAFYNRQFIDSGSGYTYTTYFGDNNDATKNGRMIGRTRFFSTDSDGNITYPSNHYIYARTSKDVLNNLIYKGTQYDGSNSSLFDPIFDPLQSTAAYTIDVGGSDTLKKLKVIR